MLFITNDYSQMLDNYYTIIMVRKLVISRLKENLEITLLANIPNIWRYIYSKIGHIIDIHNIHMLAMSNYQHMHARRHHSHTRTSMSVIWLRRECLRACLRM